MRIGLDATAIPPDRAGAGNYIFNLVRALAKIDCENEYFVFAKTKHVVEWGIGRENFHFISGGCGLRGLRVAWEQVVLPWRLRQHRVEVLHSPHYTMPLAASCPSVVTFCDLTFCLYPELHTRIKRLFFQTMMRQSARRSRRIIAISQSTAEDIIRVMQVPGQKVRAIPLAASPSFRPVEDRNMLAATCRRYGLEAGSYILYVGVLEPRKNLPTLLHAYRRLVERGVREQLVVVGRKGWMYDEIFRTLASLELERRVIFTGYVPEDDLRSLYAGARVFVYPSIYEGFGLPVLEAMACGAPVVTSNVSSMPEVAGEAAVLVDPRSHEELAAGIERILEDEDMRDWLCKRGLEQASQFTWERTARETRRVYFEACRLP